MSVLKIHFEHKLPCSKQKSNMLTIVALVFDDDLKVLYILSPFEVIKTIWKVMSIGVFFVL